MRLTARMDSQLPASASARGAVHANPGDVDEDVQTAEACRRGIHHPARFRLVAQVGRHRQHVRRREPSTDLFGRGLGGGAVTVHQHQTGAFLGKEHGGGGADAASAAGDERDFSVKAGHAGLP